MKNGLGKIRVVPRINFGQAVFTCHDPPDSLMRDADLYVDQ